MKKCKCGCNGEIIEKEYRNLNVKLNSQEYILGHNKTLPKKIVWCVICNKKIFVKITSNVKCCSLHCASIKRQQIMKEKNQGWYNSNFQKKMNSRVNYDKMKLNKVGFFNFKVQSSGGKAAQKTLKEKKLSAFYNPELNRQIRLNISKSRGTYLFKGILFDSRREVEMAYNLFYQFYMNLKERINCHFLIGLKEIDFKIDKFKLFIEVHPKQRWPNQNSNYYQIRKKILNSGGFENYSLIIIK